MSNYSSFYSESELEEIGFRSIGTNVLISRYSRIYGAGNMVIGSNVRIDDFCLLSGEICLGNNIHISAFSALYGKGGIEMQDYTGLSPRCTVFSATDDFSGDYMIGPMTDSRFTNVREGRVVIMKYSQIGSNCVILPAVTIGVGVAVGAMSLVTRDLDEWKIYKGIPASYFKDRSRKLLDFGL
jgi:galactoside O-acetyltransferase